jgi:DNA-binding NtrC family response regulator
MMTQRVIAVVDDEPDLVEVLEALLRDAGYDVVLWDQGKGAYELIRQVQPALVILDLWLEHPGAGGMVLGMLELDPTTRHIPVIVCSAHQQLFRDQQALLQDKGYILLEKPFDVDVLLAHIARLLT